MKQAVDEHWEFKLRQREFGYFNYGDWYGERGHNWGNNEYDMAYGLFIHFARTGNRKAARLASASAQHQADVDIVHAYPDPYYIGGSGISPGLTATITHIPRKTDIRGPAAWSRNGSSTAMPESSNRRC